MHTHTQLITTNTVQRLLCDFFLKLCFTERARRRTTHLESRGRHASHDRTSVESPSKRTKIQKATTQSHHDLIWTEKGTAGESKEEQEVMKEATHAQMRTNTHKHSEVGDSNSRISPWFVRYVSEFWPILRQSHHFTWLTAFSLMDHHTHSHTHPDTQA